MTYGGEARVWTMSSSFQALKLLPDEEDWWEREAHMLCVTVGSRTLPGFSVSSSRETVGVCLHATFVLYQECFSWTFLLWDLTTYFHKTSTDKYYSNEYQHKLKFIIQSVFLLVCCFGSDLEVRCSFEGLITDAADMTAVVAVSLFAVASQWIGVLAHLIAEEAMVPVLALWMGVLLTFITRIL